MPGFVGDEHAGPLLEALMETSIDGILVINDDREYVTWNQQFVEMWGVPDELLESGDEEPALEWVLDTLERPDEFIQKVEYLYDHPREESRDQIHLEDGRTFDRYSSPVIGGDGTHYGRVWFFRDITDLKDREWALAEERDKYQTVVQESNDAIAIHQDGRFVFANERCLEMLGYDEDELVGKPLTEIVAPEDRELVQRRYERRIGGDDESPPDRYETHFLTKEGDRRVSEVSAARTRYEGAPADLVTVRDVTERRRREARLAELTEELETLNRVVRHDIRNDMSVVLGWAELLDEHVSESGRDYLEKIIVNGEHIVELTDSVRDYVNALTSGEELTVEPTSLRGVVEHELDLRRASFPDAEFVLEGEIPELEVRANEMLESVFRNLLNNAVQHNDRDNPRVTVSFVVHDEGVVVQIADNGPGISDERKESIFGKGERGLDSPGTGIGLYLVQTLVDGYGGRVWIEDVEPDGAEFNVQLLRD